MLLQLFENSWIQLGDLCVLWAVSELINARDSCRSQFLPLAFSHVCHKDQIALALESFVDECRPAAVITPLVFRNGLRIEALEKLCIAIPELLIPGPEVLRSEFLERTATEIHLELFWPVAEMRSEQLAVGQCLNQKSGFGLAGELALDRDVAPFPQQRGLINAPEQVGTAAHLVVAERGLVDELHTLPHRLTGGCVVGFSLFAGQPGNAVALFFQLAEQHLLVAQAIGKQLLIQLTHRWLAVFKQLLRLQLFPPGPDHWADAEQRQLAGCDREGLEGLVPPQDGSAPGFCTSFRWGR